MRSLPDISTYDQKWESNFKSFDLESSTGPHAPMMRDNEKEGILCNNNKSLKWLMTSGQESKRNTKSADHADREYHDSHTRKTEEDNNILSVLSFPAYLCNSNIYENIIHLE